MADVARAIRPKIDDGYWFSMSEELVNKSLTRHEEVAGKFQTFILWLWGIYTSYAAVGASLSSKTLPISVIVIVASASAAVIAVYWATVWVQAPVAVEFDPRSPDQIKDAFNQVLDVRQRRLKLTILASVGAAFLVAAAVLLLSIVKEEKVSTRSLAAAIVGSGTSREVTVAATVDASASAKLSVEPVGAYGNARKQERNVLPTSSGVIQTSVAIDHSTNVVRVSLEWQGRDGLTWVMAREVKRLAKQ